MSENNRFLEAYGIKVVEQEKLNVPSKPERIAEAAGYVHRNILYSLENLGGGQWALVVGNKDNKEKFERHPLDSKMIGSVLDSLKEVDFDNWNLAKSSMAKLQFKQLGVVEPVVTKKELPEPPKVESKKKFEAKKDVVTVDGKTKSGKDIYSEYDHPSHADFSKEDHEDASKLYRNRWGARKSSRENEENHRQEKMHHYAAIGKDKKKKEEPAYDRETAKARAIASIEKQFGKKNEEDNGDFARLSELKDRIKRYEEAKQGCEMTGQMNKARYYQKEIDSMTKEMNTLDKKMNKGAEASAKQKGLDDGYVYELNLTDKEQANLRMEKMGSSNNFYDAVVDKMMVACSNGKTLTVQIKDYSPSYKGGILYVKIGNAEFPLQLSKKNVKISDIKFYLPV